MMLLYATTVRLGMPLKKRRMVWSAKCLEPQSKTLFMATVFSCTQPVAGESAKTENKKENANLGIKISVLIWCTRQESNLWPSESESDALSN